MKLCDFGFARAVGKYMHYVHMFIVSVYSTFGVYIYLQCVSTVHAVCTYVCLQCVYSTCSMYIRMLTVCLQYMQYIYAYAYSVSTVHTLRMCTYSVCLQYMPYVYYTYVICLYTDSMYLATL